MACKTITIFGSKGGVGKTFVAVNLATTLALSKKKVLLVDFDSSGSQDLVRMLNVSPRNSLADIIPLLGGAGEAGQVKSYTTIHSSKLEVLPFVSHMKQLRRVTSDNIRPFFKKANEDYDYIIVDAGKDFTEILMTIFDYSNLILLVATPDILAVSQVQNCLEILQRMQFPIKMIKLLLNRSESMGSYPWTQIRETLSCEIFSHIPSDGKAVGLALNRGVPCVINSSRGKIADAFNKIAHMLKKESLYIPTSEINRDKSTEEAVKPDGKFWDSFKGASGIGGFSGSIVNQAEDETVVLKKKIHEKLVDGLNKEGITIDNLSDRETLLEVKKMSEEIVANLIIEETGGKISSHEERVRLVRDIVNEALGLGPLEDLLADDDVTDIMVNCPQEIYVEKSGKLILTNKRFLSNDKMRSIVDRIIAPLGRRIDESTPMVDARLPDGSRFNAIIPPLSLRGPMMTIRKFGKERLEIDDLISRYNSMTPDIAEFLRRSVECRKNMIVSGGTGSGKTTLLNVISEFIPQGERIITIEDAAELQLKQSHWARLESRPMNIEGRGEVTIRDLFTNCLRMRPDRIVIGECRGGEVLDMLQAMNTGHDGSLTTLHANSTRDVMTRLNSLILLAGIELPQRAINEMISSAIDLVVHVNRFSDGTRKITGVTETLGLDKEYQLILKDVFVFKQEGIGQDGKVLGDYTATGYIPEVYEDFVTRGIPFDKSKFDPK